MKRSEVVTPPSNLKEIVPQDKSIIIYLLSHIFYISLNFLLL